VSGIGDRRRGIFSLGLSSARFDRRCEILCIACVVRNVVLSFELWDKSLVLLSSSNSASMEHFNVIGGSLERETFAEVEP